MAVSRQHSRRARRISPALCLLTTAFLGGLALPPAAGQGTKIILRGDPKEVSGVTVTSWGSGKITEDKQVVYAGSQSLRIASQGLYQGADLSFANPIDLAPYIENKNAYLEVAMMPPPRDNTLSGRRGGRGGFPGGLPGGPGGAYGGIPGGPGGFPGGGRPGGGRGGFPGGGGRGQGGAFGTQQRGGQQIEMQTPRNLENLHIQMFATNGAVYDFLLPLSSGRDENRWKLLTIPVAAIPGIKADDTVIKGMRIAGDASATFHLGQIRLLIDATPITIAPMGERTATRNESYLFTVTAAGGSVPLKYVWDFDDKDGIQEEKEGRVVRHTYRKAGDYVVTVTVSDLYGLKAPKTMKFKVHVSP